MVEILKSLANEKRLKIIYALTLGDFCQIHVEEITKISQVDISRNVKKLIDAGVVTSTKEKQRVIYSLSPSFKNEYLNLLVQIIKEYSYLSDNIDDIEIKNRCKNFEKDFNLYIS